MLPQVTDLAVAGIFIHDGSAFRRFIEKENIGSALLADQKGNIWFGGGEQDDGAHEDGGIWLYDGKLFRNITTKDGLGEYTVWCMVEDRAGNIWIGSRNTELYRYDGKAFEKMSE